MYSSLKIRIIFEVRVGHSVLHGDIITLRILLLSPGSVSPGQEYEDQGINYHQPGEHEELRGLLAEHLGLGHKDDDEVPESDREKPGGSYFPD